MTSSQKDENPVLLTVCFVQRRHSDTYENYMLLNFMCIEEYPDHSLKGLVCFFLRTMSPNECSPWLSGIVGRFFLSSFQVLPSAFLPVLWYSTTLKIDVSAEKNRLLDALDDDRWELR